MPERWALGESGSFHQQHVAFAGPKQDIGLAVSIEISALGAGGFYAHGSGAGPLQ